MGNSVGAGLPDVDDFFGRLFRYTEDPTHVPENGFLALYGETGALIGMAVPGYTGQWGIGLESGPNYDAALFAESGVMIDIVNLNPRAVPQHDLAAPVMERMKTITGRGYPGRKAVLAAQLSTHPDVYAAVFADRMGAFLPFRDNMRLDEEFVRASPESRVAVPREFSGGNHLSMKSVRSLMPAPVAP